MLNKYAPEEHKGLYMHNVWLGPRDIHGMPYDVAEFIERLPDLVYIRQEFCFCSCQPNLDQVGYARSASMSLGQI